MSLHTPLIPKGSCALTLQGPRARSGIYKLSDIERLMTNDLMTVSPLRSRINLEHFRHFIKQWL